MALWGHGPPQPADSRRYESPWQFQRPGWWTMKEHMVIVCQCKITASICKLPEMNNRKLLFVYFTWRCILGETPV